MTTTSPTSPSSELIRVYARLVATEETLLELLQRNSDLESQCRARDRDNDVLRASLKTLQNENDELKHKRRTDVSSENPTTAFQVRIARPDKGLRPVRGGSNNPAYTTTTSAIATTQPKKDPKIYYPRVIVVSPQRRPQLATTPTPLKRRHDEHKRIPSPVPSPPPSPPSPPPPPPPPPPPTTPRRVQLQTPPPNRSTAAARATLMSTPSSPQHIVRRTIYTPRGRRVFYLAPYS